MGKFWTIRAPYLLQNGFISLNTPKMLKGSTSEQVRNQAQQEMQDFWERNIKASRPRAPHLSIYKPPLVMNLSLMHRATGIAMGIAWAGIGCSAYLFTGHYDEALNFIKEFQMGDLTLGVVKFILCYPLVYHYLNGMRHLVSLQIAWDYAIGFKMSTIYKTGYGAIISSLVVAGLLASLKL
ncbi:unnamed protein product [Protopolystoma xenopodis]|uniref:Uncharacterized protein n=1 Tax=Protopolystoma xenopodis TaxID=117903 RepID=A0A448WRM2_9PLAT|nr:unnamed protein product [Protopolystoma xenopodis]